MGGGANSAGASSNHEIYRVSAGTLDSIAAYGDLVIASNYAKVGARSLVVSAVGSRLLARRYNESDQHPEIGILTGHSTDPYALVEPVIVQKGDLEAKKIVGVSIFRSVDSAARDYLARSRNH